MLVLLSTLLCTQKQEQQLHLVGAQETLVKYFDTKMGPFTSVSIRKVSLE